MVDEERESRQASGTRREILDELKDWSGKVFQKVREEADSLSTKGRLKIDIATLRSKRGSEFKKLGQKVHRLLEEGNFDTSAIEDDIARIDQLADEIRSKEGQARDLGRKAEADETAGDAEEKNKAED